MEISKITWRAALSGTAFVKRSAVYGHIDENGASVRKLRFAYGQTIKNVLFVRKFE